uniref:Uncharacterized protein n=1 Tax=Sphaerodactylus townsendi TaxID=933632 RepID=A0ACB8GE84_9SAUR
MGLEIHRIVDIYYHRDENLCNYRYSCTETCWALLGTQVIKIIFALYVAFHEAFLACSFSPLKSQHFEGWGSGKPPEQNAKGLGSGGASVRSKVQNHFSCNNKKNFSYCILSVEGEVSFSFITYPLLVLWYVFHKVALTQSYTTHCFSEALGNPYIGMRSALTKSTSPICILVPSLVFTSHTICFVPT